MIEKLGKYIVDNSFEEFKKLLSNSTVNAHHREQMYKLAFFNQNEQILDFLNSKVSLSKEKKADFFIESLNKRIKIVHFKYINDYDDMYLASKIKNLLGTSEDFTFFATATDFSAPNRIMGQKPFVIMKNKEFITLSVDNYRYKLLLARNQTIFATLGFASHTIWFFGSLFLIWFHQRRKTKNRMFLTT